MITYSPSSVNMCSHIGDSGTSGFQLSMILFESEAIFSSSFAITIRNWYLALTRLLMPDAKYRSFNRLRENILHFSEKRHSMRG